MKDFERTSPTSARARRIYDVSPDELLEAVKEAVASLDRWTFGGGAGTRLHAVRTSRIFRFKDDVTVGVSAHGPGSEAVFESASRVGKGDLGQNPRNLRDLICAVDRLLGSRP